MRTWQMNVVDFCWLLYICALCAQSSNDNRIPTWASTAHSGRVPSESVFNRDWHGRSTGHKFESYLRYQGRYRCWVLKPSSSLDPLNLRVLSLCLGYGSPLVQWDCNRCNERSKLHSLNQGATLEAGGGNFSKVKQLVRKWIRISRRFAVGIVVP